MNRPSRRRTPSSERRRSGELESAVLTALWASPEPMVPAQVQAAVAGDLAYTTVMTILVRLYNKGVIKRAKIGRAFAYRPAVAETDVVADHVRRLLDRGQDRAAVLQGMLDGLDRQDEQVLRSMLAQVEARRNSDADSDS